MQATLYYSEEDEYLMSLVDRAAVRARKSRSGVIMSILEEHFERDKRLGEILVDMGAAVPADVERALEHQRSRRNSRLLGEILVEEGAATRTDVDKALVVQGRVQRS